MFVLAPGLPALNYFDGAPDRFDTQFHRQERHRSCLHFSRRLESSVILVYDVTANGKEFLIDSGNLKECTEPLTLVQHWPSELKK